MFKSVTTITKILFGVTVTLAAATTISAIHDKKAAEECNCDECPCEECPCSEVEAEEE